MISRAIILAGEMARDCVRNARNPKPLVPVQGTPIATWLVVVPRHGVVHVTVIYPPLEERFCGLEPSYGRRTV